MLRLERRLFFFRKFVLPVLAIPPEIANGTEPAKFVDYVKSGNNVNTLNKKQTSMKGTSL